MMRKVPAIVAMLLAIAPIQAMADVDTIARGLALSRNYTLAQSGTASAALTGTTSETVIASVPIRGYLLGPNSSLRITTIWTVTGTNTKTLRVRVGGISGSIISVNTATTNITLTNVRILRNRGARNSQVAVAPTSTIDLTQGASSAAVSTYSIDFAANTTIDFTAQLTNTGESAVLEAYTIEVLP